MVQETKTCRKVREKEKSLNDNVVAHVGRENGKVRTHESVKDKTLGVEA